MSNPVFRLTVLGARGSMAVSGDGYHLFGGMTSCYHVQAGEENLFLDAGTGLLRAPVRFPHPPVILLTHLHLDHILGLGMYSRMSMRGEETRILVPVCAGEDPRVHLDRLYSPPLWPLSLADYNGDVRIESLSLPLSVGDVLVEGIRGCHPGNSTILKLSRAGKSLVYATDYEYESATFSSLIDFSRGADLILYDGQYTAQEALDMGMVNKVVPLAELEDECVRWAEEMMERSPIALRMIKAGLNAELDGQAGIQQLAGDATMLYYFLDEAQEGGKAFLEKRKPDFDQYPKIP